LILAEDACRETDVWRQIDKRHRKLTRDGVWLREKCTENYVVMM
jgi:hypothetical protein